MSAMLDSAGMMRRAAPLRQSALRWLGLLPFGTAVLLFLGLPALSLLWGSFHTHDGAATVANYRWVGDPQFLKPFWNSVILSSATMLTGGIGGLVIAQALVSSRSGLLHELGITFSSVAANFAGVPLAFSFIATAGVNGLVTKFLLDYAGVDIYGAGYSLYTLVGIVTVYTYFQLPLMVLLILPSLEAVDPRWEEAAANLGASRWTYLRRVAIPILAPAVLSSWLLLFANAFGAYATVYALTTGFFPVVPILISSVISGDVSFDPGQGDALAMGMAAVMAVCMVGQALLQRRASRWLKR